MAFENLNAFGLKIFRCSIYLLRRASERRLTG
jgi:hypothetical protein